MRRTQLRRTTPADQPLSSAARAALYKHSAELRAGSPEPNALERTLGRAYWAIREWLALRVHERNVATKGLYVDIDHFDPEFVPYYPSDWATLRRALPRREVGPEDVFLDFGCGKGRVVLQAATRYGFRRVIGVEISAQLAAIARANVERNAARLRCEAVEIVTANAAEYVVPDDVTHAYLYYPFSGRTFEKVVDNVVSSLDRRPRRLALIYLAPKLEDVVLASKRFRVKKRTGVRFARGIERQIGVYESV